MSMKVFSQSIDTILVQVDMLKYKSVAKKNFEERYEFTVNSENKLTATYNLQKKDLITFYPKEEILLTSIPIFKFKNTSSNHKLLNVAKWIDFQNNYLKQNFNLYQNDTLLLDSSIEFKDPRDFTGEMYYMLRKFDYNEPRIGNLSGFMYKLSLEKKYFTFLLHNFAPDVFFIVRRNKIFAVYLKNHKVKQMEINKYFFKIMNKSLLQYIIEDNGNIEAGINISSKSYNDNYFVKLNITE